MDVVRDGSARAGPGGGTPPGERILRRALEPLLAAMRWLGSHELGTLVAVALVACGLWAFVELADEVLEGGTETLDRRLLLALRSSGDPTDPLGPRWLEELLRDVTALGGFAVLALLTLAVAGFLLLHRKLHAAGLVVATVAGGMLASTLLKQLFDRARPDLVPHGAFVHTPSFPSGHSMLSAVVYLTLGAMLARTEPRLRDKAYVLLIAVLLTLAIGFSRVYLGVHWPTDVIAGWTVGAAWAVGAWLAMRWLQARGQVEPDADLDEEAEPPSASPPHGA